jgi:hypothetical protein
MNYNLKVYPSGALELNFIMPDYGLYQDKGVKGSIGGKRKAVKSPYKFTGSNIKKGVIENWLKRKGIQGRVKKEWKSAGNRGGQFIKRKKYCFIWFTSFKIF